MTKPHFTTVDADAIRKMVAKGEIDPAKHCRIYWNLHKDCYSVRQAGIVRCHADNVYLKDVTFPVQEGGRELVLRSGAKNVHAFVRGVLCGPSDGPVRQEEWRRVSYNPHRAGHFVTLADLEPILEAKYARLFSWDSALDGSINREVCVH